MRGPILCLGCWVAAAALAVPSSLAAPAPVPLRVTLDAFRTGGLIPPVYAFCVPVRAGHTAPGRNISPAMRWSRGPARTASYAIVMADPDVPAIFTDANKEGRVLSARLARRSFYHWLLVDIPPSITALADGADSKDRTAKPAGPTSEGLRGLNDDGGGRAGYDGPCPPWNDAIVHHYHFQVYALDVAHLPLPDRFVGADVVRAIGGHVLAKGGVVGLYTQNPDVARTLPK